MNTSEKRRGQCRYVRHDKLFAQILVPVSESSEKLNAKKVTLLCHSCDASINGLKIEIERQLEVKSSIDLWMTFEGLENKFYLRGHVCWCHEAEELSGLYQVGIELEDVHATDYAQWIELLSSFSI